jgi:hypothetical protein
MQVVHSSPVPEVKGLTMFELVAHLEPLGLWTEFVNIARLRLLQARAEKAASSVKSRLSGIREQVDRSGRGQDIWQHRLAFDRLRFNNDTQQWYILTS